MIEQLWAGTVAKASEFDPALLHERVDGEWSFIESSAIWSSPPMHGCGGHARRPIAVGPWDEMPDTEGIPRDRVARPTLTEVLALRADRMATVRQVVGSLTDEQLAGSTTPVPDRAGPHRRAPRPQVLGTILDEEWWHRQFAERDLAALRS